MANDDYATFASAWAQICASKAVACVREGRYVFSFRLRPSASVTPATLGILIESRYLDAAFLKPTSHLLEPLPLKFRQAPRDSLERRELFRLFDGFLLRGALPDDLVLMPRAHFEDEHLRAFEAVHPNLYAHMVKMGNVTCLGRIRNCGSLSPAQEATVRSHMTKKARKEQGADAPARDRDKEAEARKAAQEKSRRDILAMRQRISDDPA